MHTPSPNIHLFSRFRIQICLLAQIASHALVQGLASGRFGFPLIITVIKPSSFPDFTVNFQDGRRQNPGWGFFSLSVDYRGKNPRNAVLIPVCSEGRDPHSSSVKRRGNGSWSSNGAASNRKHLEMKWKADSDGFDTLIDQTLTAQILRDRSG